MQPIHFVAPAALSPYVAFFGVIDSPEDKHEPYVSPPLGLCGFIICLLGQSNATVNGKLFMNYPHCATGQVTGPVVGTFSGRSKYLLVFMHPGGLYELFGLDMSKMVNASLPLPDLLGKDEAARLIQQLTDASDHQSMVSVMSDYLLAQQPIFEIAPKIKKAIQFIHQQKGNATVKEIERYCFITPRSLERHFKLYIGLTPTEYSKIYQFKGLVNFIMAHPRVTWAELCEQNGYYDQSHLTRYFTRYLNVKPGELVSLNLELINYLLQD